MRCLSVSTLAANTSFHDTTKLNTIAAASPGSASGATMRTKPCRRLQPSVQAASSSSRGMAMNSDDDTSTANGSASAVCTSATPRCVSYSPTAMKRVTSGSARMASGKARVITISTRYRSAPLKSKRASA